VPPPLDLPPSIALRLAVAGPEEAPPLAALSAAERERMASFGSEKRRRAFALGRATARGLLAERLGVAPEVVPLAVAADGAVEAPGLCLSLAHTASGVRAVAAAVAAAHAVGVDVEALRPRHPDLAGFLLHPDEGALLDALPYGPALAPVVLWAVKEAVLKAQRTGLRVSPKKLLTHLDVDRQRGVVHVEGGAVWAVRYGEHAGCVLAVAFPAE